jgi:hypothetical protein
MHLGSGPDARLERLVTRAPGMPRPAKLARQTRYARGGKATGTESTHSLHAGAPPSAKQPAQVAGRRDQVPFAPHLRAAAELTRRSLG